MITIKKLVVFGGTFSPPHIGHLLLAQNALYELNADKIVFMTSGNPPHKDSETVIDKKHRYEMVKLLTADNDAFVVSDLEVNSDEKSYTADTLLKLKEIYKDTEIYFIVGLDSFYDIEKWYRPDLIFKRCIIAVSLRGGFDAKGFEEKAHYYKSEYDAKIVKILMPVIEISSSDIRRRIIEGKPVKYMLTKEVLEYIEMNDLFKE